MELHKRQNSLPVLHVRGTFYEVGYNVGRTFSGIIKTLIDTHPVINTNILPAYNTEQGKIIYQETLHNVTDYYPNYLKELQGIADGAGVPFYKLFLYHIDGVLPAFVNQTAVSDEGCSTICLNMNSHELIGHTEDAVKEVLNNIYILNAYYTDSPKQEHFVAFCYAGLLPGYAMGYNKHGLVFSMNIISAKHLGRGKLPRKFVMRELLAADSIESVIKTLETRGIGIADAMSVNLTFLNDPGERVLYNIEVSPDYPKPTDKSVLSIQKVCPGDVLFHANKFIRLKIPVHENVLDGSSARHETRDGYNIIDSKSVYDLLSDETNQVCKIFRSDANILTVAVGFFDFIKRTWTIYLDNPNKCEPIAVFSLDL